MAFRLSSFKNGWMAGWFVLKEGKGKVTLLNSDDIEQELHLIPSV